MTILYGTSSADVLNGAAGDDIIYGGFGDDAVDGGDGNDILYGDDGADTVNGGAGSDQLYGGEGADTLDGGAGADRIFIQQDAAVDRYRGGLGSDVFDLDLRFTFPPQSSLQYLDHIADFSASDGDLISFGAVGGKVTFGYLYWAGAVQTAGFTLAWGQSLQGGVEQFMNVWSWKSGDINYLIIDAFQDGILDNRDIVLAFDGAPTLDASSFVSGTFVAKIGGAGPDTWTGTAGDDVFYAGAGDDKVSGLGGNDYLVGEAGSDTLDGGDGDDRLTGDYGSDTLYGGAGNDTLSAGHSGGGDDSTSANFLYGGDGNDDLSGAEGKDTLEGGAGDDALYSAYGDGDVLRGGDGKDRLEANGATLDGGAGDDTIFIGVKNLITGGGGADMFSRGVFLPWDQYGYSAITDFKAAEGDRLDIGQTHVFERAVFRGALVNPEFSLTIGKSFSSNDYGDGFTQFWTWTSGGDTYLLVDQDRSTTLTANDYVLKFTGAVTLDASAFAYNYFTASTAGGTDAADVFNGTSAADTYDGFGGDDQIHGGAGDDTLYGARGADQIWGDAGSDKLYGGEGDDIIDGGDGFDTIYGGRGADTIHGGADNDTIYYDEAGEAGGNVVYGDGGDDFIQGGASLNNRIYGGDGVDIIYGNGVIHGDAGNDLITGGDGPVTIYGDAGDDFIAANAGAAIIYGGVGADQIAGGYSDDILNVDLGDRYVSALSGNDKIFISAAPADESVKLKSIDAGDGADVFVIVTPLGEKINLALDGGPGDDTLDLSRATGAVEVDLAKTGGQQTGMGQLTLTGVNSVIGGDKGSALSGDAYANVLTGGAGDDRLSGRDGADVLKGGGGDDILDGGAGQDDARYGGSSKDYLIGVDINGWNVRDTGAAGDGFDRLLNVESLAFSDRAIALGNPVVGLAVAGLMRVNAATGSGGTLVLDLTNKISTGALTQSSAVAEIVRAAGATTSVATLAYEFFTGKIPGQAGIDYLVSPAGLNPNNLNSAYYQSFNLENRYINFAVNLGKNGEGKDAFTAKYGALSLFDAAKAAYKTIFGATPTDEKTHALIDSRADYFAYYGGDGPNGVGTKAAMVGWLLAEAQKADLGVMVRSNDAWLTDLADGSAPFAVDILDPAKGYYKPDFIFGGA